MILEPLPKHTKRALRLLLQPFSAEFQQFAAMKLKILFIAVLFVGASVAFSLHEEQEDAPNEYEAQELEEISKDEEYDLEDPTVKGRKPVCPKLNVRRCYVVKYCYRSLRICRCVPIKKYGDETGFGKQLNDEMLETLEDEAENSDEPNEKREDPSKKGPKPKPSPKCPKKLIRRYFFVKDGKSWRIVCSCVKPCRYYYGDEAENDYEVPQY